MANQKLPLVAIVGQTNAGKSSLFNRLAGFSRENGAIVAREAGTTRDSVVREVTLDDENYNSREKTHFAKRFLLVDTAGLKNPEDEFEATIQDQVDDAIDSADLILLVKDSTEFATQKDRDLARKILKSKKKVLLILNKIDLKGHQPREEFLRLGIRDIYEISAEHNQGMAKLRAEISKNLPQNSKISVNSDEELFDENFDEKNESEKFEEISAENETLKIALIGRPNVGKSNLFNALSQKQQAIVAPIAGTTRDINRVKIKFKKREIELLDTAGVRRSGKIEQGIEKFSVLRTVSAIEESDVCLLLIDVNELNTALDQKLAGMIAEAGKGLVLVVSKWDSVEDKDAFTRDALAPQIAAAFDFVPWAPLIFTSSITGQNVTKIFEIATQIFNERQRKIPTRKLNDVLQRTVASHPPAGLKNTHPKFRYIVQTDISPPWFVIYGANFKFIHWSYKRFLENNFRKEFGFNGTPINFSFRDEKQIKANRENDSR